MTTTIDTPAVTPMPDLPDEVVTHALVRDVRLPSGGVMALITLDNGRDHTRPTTFGPGGLKSLDAALDAVAPRAAAGEIVAVGVTGKPFYLCAGADLNMPKAASTHAESAAGTRWAHGVFRRLGELGVPSFGFVNGAALGGGLEVALHCTYRTVSSAVPAVALPETLLGLIPGWGGTFLLPNLIGPAKALEIIVNNPLNQGKIINGRQAFEAGLADAMFDAQDFLEQSILWADDVLAGRAQVRRAEIDRSEEAWGAAVAAARAFADSKLHGAAPAPYRAIDLVALARTADRDEAFEAESVAIADLVTGDELHASLYAFDLTNKRAKRPAGAPDKSLARKVTTIGVVGAGLMASQMALLFARRLEVPVILTDLDQARVDKGVAYVHGEIDKLLLKGRLSQDRANRYKALVSGSTDKAAFAAADVVIEAVFERMDVKKQVFAEVEAVVSPECILMTNTSSLSVTEMAAGLQHPERVVGFHFFNPVAIMPLVEIVTGEQTSDVALATAFAVGKTLKKTCVLVKDAPAFVVNRLLTAWLNPVFGCLDAGCDPAVADGAFEALGFPMTPFVLLQLVGPAVALHTGETLHEAFPDRYAESSFLPKLVAAGRSAVWSYDEAGTPYLDDEVRAMLPEKTSDMTADEVRERAFTALAREIRIMLDEGIVVAPEDIDLCMIFGAGWPFVLGGITPYLDRSGIAEQVTGRRFLAPGVASRPA